MLPVLLEKKRKMQMCHAKMRVPRYAKGRNLLQGLANQATTLGLNKGVSKQLLRCTAGISLPAAASCLTIFLQPKDRKKSFSAFSDLPRRHASKTGWKFSMQKRVEDKTRQKPISLPSKDLGDLWTFVFSSLQTSLFWILPFLRRSNKRAREQMVFNSDSELDIAMRTILGWSAFMNIPPIQISMRSQPNFHREPQNLCGNIKRGNFETILACMHRTASVANCDGRNFTLILRTRG